MAVNVARPLIFMLLLLFAQNAFSAGSFKEISDLYDSSDPLALKDPYDSIADSETLRDWAHDEDDRPLSDLLDELDQNKVIVYVRVVLVGLDGLGLDRIQLNLPNLKRYLNTATNAHFPAVIHSDVHHLNTSIELFYEVEHGPSALAESINQAVSKDLRSKQARPAVLSHSLISNFVQTDHKSRNLGYTVYIILPSQTESYYYSSNSNADDASASCGTTLWLGEDRYAWIDLGAQVTSRGPSELGEGAVTPHSLPSVSQFKTATSFRQDEFEASLSAFVHRVVEHAIIPPLDRTAMLKDKPLELRLYHIKTGDSKSSSFDWTVVQRMLQNAYYPGHRVTFTKATLTNADILMFMLAYKTSIKSVAYHHPNEAPEERIDGPLLRNQLLQYFPLAPNLLGSETRVVPVILFDVDNARAMLDGLLANAFDDIVIASAGRQSDYLQQFQCQGKELSQFPSSSLVSDLTRSVVASILQTAWGVAPSFQTWSTIHNATTDDFLFAVGLTPFGPFSNAESLNFGLRDGIQRSLFLWRLHNLLIASREPLSKLQRFNLQVADVLSSDHLETFKKRFSLFRRKLSQSIRAFSFHNLLSAFYFLRSSAHDAQHLKSILTLKARKPVLLLPESCAQIETATESSLWSSILNTFVYMLQFGGIVLAFLVLPLCVTNIRALLSPSKKIKKI